MAAGNENAPTNPQRQDSINVVINRPIFNQEELDSCHARKATSSPGFRESLRNLLKCQCSKNIWGCVKARLPCIEWVKDYSVQNDLLGDITGGVSAGVMHIPQALAYSIMGAVPPVTGLYTSLFPVIVYSFLGSSRHANHGTLHLISLMLAGTVQQLSAIQSPVTVHLTEGNEPNTTDSSTSTTEAPTEFHYSAAEIASAICFLTGLIQILFATIRLGNLTVYLSENVLTSFFVGTVVISVSSLLNPALGIQIPKFGWPFESVNIISYVIAHIGEGHVPTFVVTAVTMIFLFTTSKWVNPYCLKKFKIAFPGEFVSVVLWTSLSYGFNLKHEYHIAVVGTIPRGLAMPSVPPVLPLATYIVRDAVAIAASSYVISFSTASLFAKKYLYELDANQEFFAMGVSNVVGSFFHCWPTCASFSRTFILASAGGKTPVSGLVSSGVVLLTLLFAAPLFQDLPQAVLAGIVLTVVARVTAYVRELRKAWTVSKSEAMVWLISFFANSLLDLTTGLIIGTICSVLLLIWRVHTPRTSLLGHLEATGIYKDPRLYPQAVEERGIKIYHFAAPISFANSKSFREKMYSETGVNPRDLLKNERRKIKKRLQKTGLTGNHKNGQFNPGFKADDVQQRASEHATGRSTITHVHAVIIDMSAVSFIDFSGLAILSQVIEEYQMVGVKVHIAACAESVRSTMETCKDYISIPREALYPTVNDAVLRAKRDIAVQQS